MKKLIHIFLFLLVFQSYAQDNYRVKKVRFAGNRSFKSSILLDKMSLQPKSGLKRLDGSKGVTFSKDLLENDVKEITYFYQQRGFIHVAVKGQAVDMNDRKETVNILITIDEGQPVLVSHIRFKQPEHPHNNITDDTIQKSRSHFILFEGDRFNEIDFLKDVAFLKTNLINSGFAHAAVNYTLNVDAEENQVEIMYHVSPGPLCYFGDIRISGANNVSDGLITKQLTFEKGDIFSQKKIDSSQEQIYALNIFHVVSVNAQPQKQEASVPIGIKVRNAARFTHKYSVGWGREDKFRAKMDVQWLRFLGGARRLNLFIKHSALEPYHVDLRFTQPAFLYPHTSFGLNPFIRRQHEPGYKIDRRGANIYVQNRLGRGLTAGAVYTFERVNLDTTSVGDFADQPQQDDLYDKSSITLSLAQNSANDIFSPSRGFNTALTLKYSGIGSGTFHYIKGVIDLRHYMGISKIVLATRIKLGYIESQDASGFIPVEDRFYSGGSTSVRGWGRHKLGPMDADGTPIGGASLLEGGLEFRIPLFGAVSSALFWDAGKVWAHGFDERFRADHALGFGLRYRTPIGPIRFDIATPVYNQDHAIRWHLSIGEAF